MRPHLPKTLRLAFASLACALGLFTAHAQAAAFPAPPLLAPLIGEDTEASYFRPLDRFSLAIELYDFVERLVPLNIGIRFGIFFQDAPGTLIPLFDAADSRLIEEPGQPPIRPRARVDFLKGGVYDADSNILQATFTPSESPFGFFIQSPGLNVLTLYSDGGLNANGKDFFAAFPLNDTEDTFVLDFTSLDLPDSVPGLYVAVVSGLVPVAAPIPLPAGLVLMGSALATLTVRRVTRRRERRAA